MAGYYVTSSGAGDGSGTSLGNAKSKANFELAQTFGGATPAGGDTIYFSGTHSTTVVNQWSGTSNASRLTLDFSGATLNTANPRINLNSKNNLNVLGYGSWSGGVFTKSCIMGTGDATAVSAGGTGNDTGGSTNVTIDGLSLTGTSSGGCALVADAPWVNAVFQNCEIVNGSIYWSDKTNSHDLTFRNLYCASPADNVTTQVDLISIGDAYNVLIEGCDFIQRTPGVNSDDPITPQNDGQRHNDIIQSYRNGGSGAGTPYGWVIRYNRLRLDVSHQTVPTTSTGDTSWLMMESLGDSGGTPGLKVYGNVFYAPTSGTESNNGMSLGAWATGTAYVYNNTFYAPFNQPTNTFRFLTSGSQTLYCRNNAGYDPNNSGGTYLNWTVSAGAAWGYNWWTGFSATSTYYGTGTGGTTNPLFTSHSTYDFSTQSGSPLRGSGDSAIGSEYNQGIAAGATWPNPTLVTRSVWDIGAYNQSSGGGATTRIGGFRTTVV